MGTFRNQSGNLTALAARQPKFGLPRLTIVLRTIWALMTAWSDRRSQRLALMHLNDDMLRDIGLSRAAASEEARKPFWQP